MTEQGTIQCQHGTIEYHIWHVGQDVRLQLNNNFGLSVSDAASLLHFRNLLQSGGTFYDYRAQVDIGKGEFTTLSARDTMIAHKPDVVAMNDNQLGQLIAVIDAALAREPLDPKYQRPRR